MYPWITLVRGARPLRVVRPLTNRTSQALLSIRRASSVQTPSGEQQNSLFEDDDHGRDSGVKDDDAAIRRSKALKKIFRAKSPAIDAATNRKLSSPFVPVARVYPSPRAKAASLRDARIAARRQLGFELMEWRPNLYRAPDWQALLELLKRTMPKPGQAPKMAALRLVLPDRWNFSGRKKSLEFLDSATALTARLHVSADLNPQAIVLRGQNEVLARAADELATAVPGIQIYKLGEVATFDYEMKQVWPIIEDAPDAGASLPKDKLHGLWVHHEPPQFWIEHRYEDTPKPETWTRESFESYIQTLVCGRLRPHLIMPLYFQNHPNESRIIDTDGKRIQMMYDAFQSPEVRSCITPSVLKAAMSFIVSRGGHRSKADQLLRMAEEIGLPVDADFYNIMLKGYVDNGDVGLFHKTLRQMESRFITPNARTWLHFLDLVKKDDERRQIVAAMYDTGVFNDPAARRGVAEIMAGLDAHEAFRAGKELDKFMKDQEKRYGEDWYTVGALNSILVEYIRFPQEIDARINGLEELLGKRFEDGRAVDMSTINTILTQCIHERDWDTVIWTLEQLPRLGLEPDADTFHALVQLTLQSRVARCLSVIFAYGALSHSLGYKAREMLRNLFLGTIWDAWWNTAQPYVLTRASAKAFAESASVPSHNVVAWVERALRSECKGYQLALPLGEALSVAYYGRKRRDDASGHGGNRTRGAYIPYKLIKPLELDLVDPDASPPTKQVVLEAQFNWNTMLREGPPPPPRREKREKNVRPSAISQTAASRNRDSDNVEADNDGHW